MSSDICFSINGCDMKMNRVTVCTQWTTERQRSAPLERSGKRRLSVLTYISWTYAGKCSLCALPGTPASSAVLGMTEWRLDCHSRSSSQSRKQDLRSVMAENEDLWFLHSHRKGREEGWRKKKQECCELITSKTDTKVKFHSSHP